MLGAAWRSCANTIPNPEGVTDISRWSPRRGGPPDPKENQCTPEVVPEANVNFECAWAR